MVLILPHRAHIVGVSCIVLSLVMVVLLRVMYLGISYFLVLGFLWYVGVVLYLPYITISVLQRKILSHIVYEEASGGVGIDFGAIIGILERSTIFIIVVTMFLSGASLREISFHIPTLFLGLFGIKGLYRIHEKKKMDWIIIGTLTSLLLGIAFSTLYVFLLEGLICL